MGRKNTNSLPPAPQMVKGVPYLPVYYGLMDSPAYRALSATQIRLLEFSMREEVAARLHSRRANTHDPSRFPTDKWELLQDLHKGKGIFYVSWSYVAKGVGLYSLGNDKTFYHDRIILVALGFWEKVTPQRQYFPPGENIKDVYILSSRWREVTTREHAKAILKAHPTKKPKKQNASD